MEQPRTSFQKTEAASSTLLNRTNILKQRVQELKNEKSANTSRIHENTLTDMAHEYDSDFEREQNFKRI